MAFKREHLESWLATEVAGDTLVSYVVTQAGRVDTGQTGTTANHGDRQRDAFAETLDLEFPYGSGWNSTFYALTNRQLLLGTRSGMRNRPKELLHRAPIEQVTVHWFDHDEGSGNRFRHFVTDFGDGTGRVDRSGLTALGRQVKSSNADHFLDALGEHARRLPLS